MWLLDSDVMRLFQARAATHYPTADEQRQYAQDFSSDPLVVVNGTASVPVRGVLTDQPDLFAEWFGGGNTTYSSIRDSLARAEADPSVSSIELLINSPGGQASAEWIATMDAISAGSKPVNAIIESIGTSAAYGIASQADRVTAVNRMSRIGSIGVAADVFTDNREVTVTSTNAPNKRPNARQPEGVAVIRQELDAIHQIFVSAIAEGRDTTPAQVNEKFGRGATLLAQDALDRGMIDAIGQRRRKREEEKRAMTLDDLKAEHGDTYREAVALGVEQERDRATAHLIMGEKSGDMATALEAVQAGSDMTATLQAKYMSAAINRQDIEDRDADNVPPVVPGADKTDTSIAAEVADLVEQQLGLQKGA